MAYKHKQNSGSLFQNDRAEKDKAPNMKGSINIEGKLFYLSAWTNISKNDKKKYLSILATPVVKTEQPAEQPAEQENIKDEDLPF